MSSSLLAGVSGLRSYQMLLEVVGNNLANVNTPGFKSSTVNFSDMLSQTIRTGSSGVGGVGGKNPIQVGLGVKATAITPDFSQGSLSSTGRVFDLALQGEGFFLLNDGQNNYCTRVGTFDVDSASDLVEVGTGYKVLDINNQPINIPLNTNTPGQATLNVNVQGNLDAGATSPACETVCTGTAFTTGGGTPVTAATDLNDLDNNTIDYIPGDAIQISGIDSSGLPVSDAFTYGADGTTVGDLINKINAAYGGATATLTAEGNIEFAANDPGQTMLALTLSDADTNTGSTAFDAHQFEVVTKGVEGATRTTSIMIYDGQASPHTLTLTFTKAADNLWNLSASIPTEEGVMIDGKIDGLTFGDNGALQAITGTGEGDLGIEVQFAGLMATQTINIDLGDPGATDGVTQYGGESQPVTAKDQDGFAAGSLGSVSIRQDGTIQGNYTNGVTSDIAVLQIATFSNPSGLRRVGDNMYQPGSNSGPAVTGMALSGIAGSVISGALEGSNVDIALEFTKLISAQRGFQVNARTITTTDQIMQELANLIR